MSKLKLALYWAGSCGGCEIAVLEIHAKVLKLVQAADIVFWPCVLDFKYDDVEAMEDGAIDVCLFNGVIETEENARIARLLRRKSKVLVAFGACSSFGGIPGLRNLYTRESVIERMYLTSESTANPEGILPAPETDLGGGRTVHLPRPFAKALALREIVPVEYSMPGCPPEHKQVWSVCSAIASGAELPPAGAIVGAGNKSVCDQCPLEKRDTRISGFKRPHEIIPDGTTCLLEQGVVCVGPATRSGCEARCPSVNMPCRGCYGPAGDTEDPGAKMVGLLGAMLDTEDEERIRALMAQVADPLGTFYRFTLPASILGRSKD